MIREGVSHRKTMPLTRPVKINKVCIECQQRAYLFLPQPFIACDLILPDIVIEHLYISPNHGTHLKLMQMDRLTLTQTFKMHNQCAKVHVVGPSLSFQLSKSKLSSSSRF